MIVLYFVRLDADAIESVVRIGDVKAVFMDGIDALVDVSVVYIDVLVMLYFM